VNRRLLAPVGYALAGACLVAAYLVLAPSRTTELLAAATSVLAAAAIAIGMLVYRPVRPVPWMLVAAGLMVAAAARVLAAYEWYGATGLRFPGAGEAWGALAFPAIFVGTVSITSDRRNARDLLAGSEPIIYAIALTAMVWVGVSASYFDEDRLPLTPETWIWVFPLLAGLLALLSLRRMRTPSPHHHLFGLMTLAFLVWGGGFVVTGLALEDGSFRPGSLIAAASMVGPLLLGLMATMPGIPALASTIGGSSRIHWTQIFGLLFASLVPLGALIMMLATGLASRSSFIVVSIATVSVIVLALARMWRLVDQVRVLTEQRGHDRLAAMVEHSSDVVLLADQHGRVNYASPGLRGTLGHNPESWVGRHLFDIIADDERESAWRQFEKLVGFGNGGTVEFEATLIHADGQHRKASVVIANLVGGSAVDGIVATFRDVTEQRNLERQLSHRAFHDELTGLANRALFLDRMDHALRITRPEADPVVVLFVDLDDFKSVNDALGHAVGDQLLKTVADRIRRAAGTGDTAARLGGDEFAILLEDRGGIDRAIDVAERLLDALRDPVSIAGYDVAVLASVGVAVATPGMNTTSLLRDADIAMYEAKRAGKGQIRIFDPAMRLVATKHLEYRSDLADAIGHGQLRIVYMPFVDLRTGQVTGAEGLVRWHHHEHGDVPASEFIPIAERSGLIVPMGYWVFEQGFAEVAKWRPDLFASFNISAVQIRQPDFVERLIEIVDAQRVDPRQIVLELTETVLVDEGDRAIETVRRLREEGFRFAIDDFGAGYCSLSYLQRHPVDMLKIDRTAIGEFGTDPRGNTLARTILQMADSLDLLTVAEGIETTGQLRELRRFGCDLGQGYLLSRPLEVDELAPRFGYATVNADVSADANA
jgi:diguanylate cyclase (GGDEF)-like protein/PAS domain S-box-containing protein